MGETLTEYRKKIFSYRIVLISPVILCVLVTSQSRLTIIGGKSYDFPLTNNFIKSLVVYMNGKHSSRKDSTASSKAVKEQLVISKRSRGLERLDSNFYLNILRLEEKIQNHDYTVETLDELIPLYAKCVEYYDSVQDPIKI